MRAFRWSIAAVLLSGCVSFSSYGHATGAELEPLAAGWEPELRVRPPDQWDSLHDQYRWESQSGVLATVGTEGLRDVTRILVEFRNRGKGAVHLRLLADDGEGVYALEPPSGSDAYRLAGETTVRIDPGHSRAFSLHGIPWLGNPRVGDRFHSRFEIRSAGTVEICPCAFEVNHLQGGR